MFAYDNGILYNVPMQILKPKYRKFLQYYKESNNILESAVRAGFKDNYARKQGKTILNRALKYQANEILLMTSDNQLSKQESKKLLRDIIGISEEDITDRLRYIAFEQNKDLNSALKVLKPVSKELGYNIEDTEETTTQPTLNVTIETQELKPSTIHKEATVLDNDREDVLLE